MLVTRLQTSAAVDAKLARHRVTVAEIREIFADRHRVRHNRRAPARIEVIGRTYAGRNLLVALDATTDDTVWEIVTAYDLPTNLRAQLP